MCGSGHVHPIDGSHGEVPLSACSSSAIMTSSKLYRDIYILTMVRMVMVTASRSFK
jgi:hypothetical protein